MPPRGAIPVTQDWSPYVIHKQPSKSSNKLHDPKAVNALRSDLSGAEVQVTKKFNAGKNHQTPATNVRKLDAETGPLTLGKVAPEVRQTIQKIRLEKKLTQADLAKLINKPFKVIQEYEAGKAIPNQQILVKLERVLGVKLRGNMKAVLIKEPPKVIRENEAGKATPKLPSLIELDRLLGMKLKGKMN